MRGKKTRKGAKYTQKGDAENFDKIRFFGELSQSVRQVILYAFPIHTQKKKKTFPASSPFLWHFFGDDSSKKNRLFPKWLSQGHYFFFCRS